MFMRRTTKLFTLVIPGSLLNQPMLQLRARAVLITFQDGHAIHQEMQIQSHVSPAAAVPVSVCMFSVINVYYISV